MLYVFSSYYHLRNSITTFLRSLSLKTIFLISLLVIHLYSLCSWDSFIFPFTPHLKYTRYLHPLGYLYIFVLTGRDLTKFMLVSSFSSLFKACIGSDSLSICPPGNTHLFCAKHGHLSFSINIL